MNKFEMEIPDVPEVSEKNNNQEQPSKILKPEEIIKVEAKSSVISNDARVGNNELRKYTKKYYSKERLRTASEIKEIRSNFFSNKEKIREQIFFILRQLEEKKTMLDIIQNEVQILEKNISSKSSSLFSQVFRYFEIKKLEETLNEKEPKFEEFQQEVQEMLQQKALLSEQLEVKQNLQELKAKVQIFYDNHIGDFEKYTEEEGAIELERLEKEEEGRQVENIMSEYNGYFVHGIKHRWSPEGNSLIKEKASFESKLKIFLSLEPTSSTSVIQVGDDADDMWEQMGLLLSRGRVDAAYSRDTGTVAKDANTRTHRAGGLNFENIKKSIAGDTASAGGTGYNEFVVSNPGVAGMYLTADREDSTTTISDKEFFALANKLKLPTYYIKNGEVFSTNFSNKEELIIGEKIDPKKLSEKEYGFSDEEKEEMFDDVFEEEMPFKAETILFEARNFAGRNAGQEHYLRVIKDKLKDTKFRKKISKTELGVTSGDDYSIDNLFKSDVYLIKEIIYPEGNKKRYFKNNDQVFVQYYDFKKDKYSNNFSTVDSKYTLPNHIALSYSRGLLFEKSVDNVTLYLSEVKKFIEDLQEKMQNVNMTDEVNQKNYKETLMKLTYHLYGFADTAKAFGDEETYQKTIKIADSVVPLLDYQRNVNKRLDEQGKFIIYKEDFYDK